MPCLQLDQECGLVSPSSNCPYSLYEGGENAVYLASAVSRTVNSGCFYTTYSFRFKATLWMSEEFPLSLMEQVTPIIDLMARTSAHFARLKDFITLEFPPGFPVKIGNVQQFLFQHLHFHSFYVFCNIYIYKKQFQFFTSHLAHIQNQKPGYMVSCMSGINESKLQPVQKYNFKDGIISV